MTTNKHFFIHRLLPNACFGMIVWLFFAIFYRHHLHYQEETQLLLLSGSYFMETIASPGGLSVYLSRFFIQFFVDSFVGGLLIALVLTGLQQAVWTVSRGFGARDDTYLLSFVPSAITVSALLDENFLLTLPIALTLVLLFVRVYLTVRHTVAAWPFLFIGLPLLYMLAGGMILVFVLFVLVADLCDRGKAAWGRALVCIVWYVALIYLYRQLFARQYPLGTLYMAGEFFRFPRAYPYSLAIVPLFAWLTPLFCFAVSRSGRRKGAALRQCVYGAVSLVLLAAGIGTLANWEKEEILGYNYFTRMQKWDAVLAKADKRAPDTPLSVAALNLALAEREYLPDFMFHYFQNGPEGLLPSFRKEYIVCAMAGEIYWRLGMVNTAQRYVFEGMETLPNYDKSVRSIQRLVETNLINERYEVAAKYIAMLKQTWFYRRWAQEAEMYLYQTEKIAQHPTWGKLRSELLTEDFFFSEQEKDMMMGLLYQSDTLNRMAYEYLMGMTLVTKNLTRFMDYYNLQPTLPQAAPTSYQEAMALIWRQRGSKPEERPVGLEDRTIAALNAFMNMYQQSKNPAQALYPSFGQTYWYYVMFRYNQ